MGTRSPPRRNRRGYPTRLLDRGRQQRRGPRRHDLGFLQRHQRVRNGRTLLAHDPDQQHLGHLPAPSSPSRSTTRPSSAPKASGRSVQLGLAGDRFDHRGDQRNGGASRYPLVAAGARRFEPASTAASWTRATGEASPSRTADSRCHRGLRRRGLRGVEQPPRRRHVRPNLDPAPRTTPTTASSGQAQESPWC